MIPIHAVSGEGGVGLDIERFAHRFSDLIGEDKPGRRAIGFLFYGHANRDLRTILHDRDAITKMDRASGRDVDLFYVHAQNEAAIAKFNLTVISALHLRDRVNLPCIVFCQISDRSIVGVDVIYLDHQNLIHGLDELLETIRNYKAQLDTVKNMSPERGAKKLIEPYVMIKVVADFIGQMI